ncbi:MAG: hypothetical protein NTY19_03625 [Planctomycetota bacterium]|nr:hypothetical protein [Planctomycetota bacterium]
MIQPDLVQLEEKFPRLALRPKDAAADMSIDHVGGVSEQLGGELGVARD